MDIIKTICPRCFKIFGVSERVEIVKCNFCEYMYDQPKFDAPDADERNNYLKRYYCNWR